MSFAHCDGYAPDVRRRSHSPELLDGSLDPATLRGNLRDLARVNRWRGGTDLSWRAIKRFVDGGAECSLLDVGTGLGDIPRDLVARAARSGKPLRVVATDVRPEIVAAALATAHGEPRFEVRLAPVDRIAEPDRSFDIVHASLVLHHLERPAAKTLLGEMARVARRAVVINDLTRGRSWWLGAWLLSHLLSGNRYTRNDAPLSVKRAYTPAEVSHMAGSVGLREIARHWTRPGYRYALVFAPTESR